MLTTRAALRALLLWRQGLLGDRISGGAAGAVAWTRRQGFLPLELQAHALAPGHDLAMLCRVSSYRIGGLDMFLYNGGHLFEHCLHLPGALPADDYTLIHDPEKVAAASRPGSPGALVLEFLREEGPATARELQAFLRRHGWSDRRAIVRAVHDLYSGGAILICNREGSLESYDLAERVLPTHTNEALPLSVRLRALARRVLEVLAPVTRPALSQTLNCVGLRSRLGLAAMKREKARIVAEMLAEGEIAQLEVEDPSERYLVPASWLERLGTEPRLIAPRVAFLSPIDPVVWDRRRARDLFGFDARSLDSPSAREHRCFGPNSLAILYGQALVGILEPQMRWSYDRLVIHGIHLRDHSLLEDQRFRAAFVDAVRELAAFHEARDIQGARSLPLRLLPS